MTKGFRNQTTKQVGEYLVAAELARRKFLATTFAGNVPYLDIVAVDEAGKKKLFVQVKTITGSSWQFNIRDFAEMRLANNKQTIRWGQPEPLPGLVCVLVVVASPRSRARQDQPRDEFYVMPWIELRKVVVSDYRAMLGRHHGRRPRAPGSFHAALAPKQIKKWQDKWDVVTKQGKKAALARSRKSARR